MLLNLGLCFTHFCCIWSNIFTGIYWDQIITPLDWFVYIGSGSAPPVLWYRLKAVTHVIKQGSKVGLTSMRTGCVSRAIVIFCQCPSCYLLIVRLFLVQLWIWVRWWSVCVPLMRCASTHVFAAIETNYVCSFSVLENVLYRGLPFIPYEDDCVAVFKICLQTCVWDS